VRRRRPPTRMIRVRVTDVERMKEMARQEDKQMPDFQSELIKLYKKKCRKRR